MTWLIRFLLFARARQLFCECAAYTLAEYGDAAGAKLRGEIDPGTPLSGRLLIWAMIVEMHRQAARERYVATKVVALPIATVIPH